MAPSNLATAYAPKRRRSACIPFEADLSEAELRDIADRIGYMPIRTPSAEQIRFLKQLSRAKDNARKSPVGNNASTTTTTNGGGGGGDTAFESERVREQQENVENQGAAAAGPSS